MDDIIDYARPTMLAERALRDMHNAVLERRYEDAKQASLEAMAQVRLAYQAIRFEEENVRKASTRA